MDNPEKKPQFRLLRSRSDGSPIWVRILDILIPLACAFGIGSIFSLICHCNPFTLYGYIIRKAFTTRAGIFNTLGYATPIIMTGIATALSIRANVYNMGIEGQVYVGAFASALAGNMITVGSPAVRIVLCFLIAMLASMTYAAIPGLLKAKLRINEVVTTIMLNNIATKTFAFLINGYLGAGDSYAHTPNIAMDIRLPRLDSKYRVTIALFIALAIWAILFFIIKRSKLGFEVDCVGKQWEFSDAVGMRVSRKIFIIFLIGGAVAGIAGASEILGVNYNYTDGFSSNPGVGWDGFYVCLLSGGSPIGILILSIVFGALRYGALSAQTGLGVPLDLINVIKSSLILFIAVRLISTNLPAIRSFFARRHAGKEVAE